MTFKQRLDPETKIYTYLLSDPDTRETVIIDPVVERVDHDLSLINKLALKPCALNTHVHRGVAR